MSASIRQEVRRMGWVKGHLVKLSPAALRWVRSVCDELLRRTPEGTEG